MKPPYDENHERLQDMLEDLLDLYPAAVIIVRGQDGDAIVVHGGDGDALDGPCGREGILRDVPSIVRAYNIAAASRPSN